MIKHYFTIAIRNLVRQKVLSFINIVGLSLGLACFSLFLLYAVNEFSFDRFHKNADNIFRVYRWSDAMDGREAGGDAYMPSPLGPSLKQDFPDVVNYVRLSEAWGESFVRVDDQVRKARLSYADPAVFSVFDFPFKYGNGKQALQGLNNVVLTRSKAKELFGSENVVGRNIQVKISDNFETFTITGVTEDIPANSSISFELIANFNYWEATRGKLRMNNWQSSSYLTYVQLKPGSGLMNDQARLAAFRHKYYPGEEKELKDAGYSWKGSAVPVRYGLQPMKDIHTSTSVFGGTTENINPKTIWILLSIAAAVLLIAAINFTTLAIGRSARRAKEVGVRKVIGGNRRQLIIQFLAEAIVLSILSAVLGFLLVKLLLPYFNRLSGRELQFSFSYYPEMSWMLGGLILLVGLLAGSYPAFILSGFRPVEVLKSKVRLSGSNLFTKSLVTVQFALSIGLIISTIIILQQTRYMSSRHPGFNKENMVVINAEETDVKRIYPLFKQSLASMKDITGIASAELGIGADEGWSSSGFEYNGKHKNVYEYYIDEDYIPVMGMKIIAGRNFRPDVTDDSTISVIVNEEMMNDFGWTVETAVGQRLTGYNENKTPVVIGVVKNFNFRPMKEKVAPQLFQHFADYTSFKFFVKLRPGNPSAALAAIQRSWSGIEKDLPLNYTFMDEKLNDFYKAEQKWSSIIGWAGGISIFLACLGLFGLAALAAVNRTREIGIRKVLGASLPGIVRLLSKDFLLLVLIALFIAAPLSWYFMHEWLQDFAYRIAIGWWVFILSGLLALLIAFLTIGVQALKTGMANPVKSLRAE